MPSPLQNMLIVARNLGARTVKHVIWSALRPFHAQDAWPMKVQAGPAQGATLVLDMRSNGAYWLGRYDNWIFSKIRISDWLPAGGVAWDCGSYVGYYAAAFRKVVGGSGRVVAFEASPSNYDSLRRMPDLNNWSNLEVVNRAVGPARATLSFAGELGGSSGPVETKEFKEPVVTTEVACSGVDELCFEQNVPQPDFIKFDLEGAETFALHNGERLFTEKRPVLLLELHGSKAVAALGEFLAKYRYHCWDVRYFNQPGHAPFTEKDGLEQAAAQLCNTMVCLPAELASRRDQVIVAA